MKPNPEDHFVLDDLEKALDQAPRPPWSSIRGPRFYPLGAHPATYRERYMVTQLRRIKAIGRDIANVEAGRDRDQQADESIAYHLRRIVDFEAGELETKAAYLREWADRLEQS